MSKIITVNTARELLSGDMSKYRPYFLNEYDGLISVDYYNKEDDGSNNVENIELTLMYEAAFETAADIKRLGKIEATIELIINSVHMLDCLDSLNGTKWL